MLFLVWNTRVQETAICSGKQKETDSFTWLCIVVEKSEPPNVRFDKIT